MAKFFTENLNEYTMQLTRTIQIKSYQSKLEVEKI